MSTMASSPKGLNSARFCGRPVDGGARREVPVGGGGARARRDREVVAVVSSCDTTARPPASRRRRRVPGVSRMSATRTRGLLARREPELLRLRRRVTAGHHRDRDVDAGAVEVGDDHGLVGTTVGLRRAFGAVPGARHDADGGTLTPARTAVVTDAESSSRSTTLRPAARRPRPPPPRSPRGGSGPVAPCAAGVCDVGAGVGSTAVTPAPTRTRPRRGRRSTGRSARPVHAGTGAACRTLDRAVPVYVATATRRGSRARARREHRPALPLRAVRDRDRPGRSTTNPLAHPKACSWRSAARHSSRSTRSRTPRPRARCRDRGAPGAGQRGEVGARAARFGRAESTGARPGTAAAIGA